MSMNLHVCASAVATLPSGKNKVITEGFDLYQTPTAVSYKLMEARDVEAAYKKWVVDEFSETVREPIYSPDDLYEDNPIGVEEINYATEHVADLERWVTRMKGEGYSIDWYVM